MAADRIEELTALLAQAKEAHGEYEATALNGVYDKEWARWYAAYAVDHGLGELVGHAVTPSQLAEFLTSTNADLEGSGPNAAEPWPAYTARRIASEL